MEKDSKSLLKRVLEVADRRISKERVEQAKQRQADMFNWQGSDYVPCLFWRAVEETSGLPEFDWAEQFEDPAASLYMQIKNVVLPQVAGGGDYVPAVRADTGVINGPSILGAPWAVPSHTKPIITGHVSRDKLEAFELGDDFTQLGTMPVMIEHTQHHLAALKRAGLWGRVGIHHCDLQGPFDILAQARGHDEVFLDLYSDGDFVHRMMAKCTGIYVAMARLCKKLVGDPLKKGLANDYWMDPGAVRVCDDSGILVGPAQYKEYLAPHLAKAIEPFGGGWIHYCGGIPDGHRPEGLHLHEFYLGTPKMRGLNFTTGKDLAGEIRKLIAARVVYLGGLPRGKEEGLEDYFRRFLGLLEHRRGAICALDIRADEHDRAVEAWQKTQDGMWR